MEAVVSARATVASGTVELTLEGRDGAPLGSWTPGAHVDVLLPGGAVRQYSLCGELGDRARWRIAVLDVPGGRGGSRALHELATPGAPLTVSGPRNTFPLVEAERYVLLAAGIGITPIVSMAESLAAGDRPWRLVHLARDRASMPFADRLSRLGDAVTLWPAAERGRCELSAELFSTPPPPGTAVYCCGPERMLRDVEQLAATWPAGTLHLERFSAGPPGAKDGAADRPFAVELRRSGLTLEVPADCSILEAVERAGVPVLSSCREGTCGTCETDVLEGEPDHRDAVLDPAARSSGDIMMICVSRSRSPRLVLDL